MRDIKFRAWLKDQNRIAEVYTLSFHGWPLEGYESVTVLTKNNSDFELVNEFELMQYTGLKDKNGKEIYEGDIVDFISVNGVDKDATKGVIRWDEEDTGFYVDNDNDKYPHVKFWFTESIEVIGNIYENPELTKSFKTVL